MTPALVTELGSSDQRGCLSGAGPDEPAVAAAAFHARTLRDLRRLALTLDAARVPWLVFKGPVLAEGLYEQPHLRPYGDLDVLVPPAAFPAAVSALERTGSRVADRNWRLIRREGRAQLHLTFGLGTPTDLHWHVLNRARVRETFAIRTEDLFSRCVPVRLPGADVWTLSPADTLVHLGVHAGTDGGTRSRDLLDLHRVVTRGTLDWEEVVERAGQWRAGAVLAVLLQRCQMTVGTPIPEGILEQLAPSRLLLAGLGMLERAFPVAQSSGCNAAAIATRMLRDRPMWALRSVLAHGRDTVLQRAEHGHGVFDGPGSRAERLAYLRWVSSQGVGQ